MPKSSEEITIAGAGISGLTAAINLAKAGRDVKVYEKSKGVGKHKDGDYQGLENWTTDNILDFLKDLNVEINFDYEPFKRCTWFSPSLEKKNYRSDEPFFYLVERGTSSDSIDKGLKRQAEELGVDIVLNEAKDEADIIATGNYPKSRYYGLGYGKIFETDPEKKKAVGFLGEDIAPLGYGYYLAWKGRSLLVVATLGEHTRKVDEYYKNLKKVKEKKLGEDGEPIEKVSGTVSFSPKFDKRKESPILIGESAGFQDLFLGFGMKYAFLSGYFASKSILENKDYMKLCRRNFIDEIKKSILNRALFETVGGPVAGMLSKDRLDSSTLGRIYSEFGLKERIMLPFAKLFLRLKY